MAESDAIYSDPRLAGIYDAANGEVDEDVYFLGLAGATPVKILDLGCGTGRLATAYSAAGHRVTGLDPSSPMLDVARGRPGGDAVTWIEGDISSLGGGERFDLIVMTGNVFQVFLTDEAIRDVLAGCRAHLDQGGRLIFETRNAEVRGWEEWTPDETREVVAVEGVGDVEVSYRWTRADLPLVTFETIHRFPDGLETVSPSTLRFVTPGELEGFLAGAGFDRVQLLGDFGGEPFSSTHHEIVAVAS